MPKASLNRIFTRYDKSDKTAFFKIATHYDQNPKSSKFSPHKNSARASIKSS
ncbi:hypothetical protein HPHPH11_0319 [Helicobacter pylori Hp H-11]|nr:hypothetical protein HPHPH11_0319 [Helicobacter pylori Hp H-11]MDU9777269.1 hypothetical protein [Helicobacter pylori]